MEFEYIYPVLILFGSFAVMLAIGVPITFAIGLSSLLSIITALPPDAAISVISQKNDCRAGWLYAISHSLLRVSRKHYEYRWYSQTTG